MSCEQNNRPVITHPPVTPAEDGIWKRKAAPGRLGILRQLLLVSDRADERFEEIVLRFQYLVYRVEPLAVQLRCRCRADIAKTGTLRVD